MLTKSQKERTFVVLAFATGIYGMVWAAVSAQWWLPVMSYTIMLVHMVIGNNIGMHRLWSHRLFTTGRLRRVWIGIHCLLCGAAVGPITYAAIHRAHHAHTDKPGDPHSPHLNDPAWHVAMGLTILRNYDDQRVRSIKMPRDLMRDPVARFVELHYHIMWLALILAVWIVWNFNVMVYALAMPAFWYILVANTATNVAGHGCYLPLSYRNFHTADGSVNSPISQIMTLGEGLHNNHHHDMTRLNQAFRPGEFDPTWWFMKWIFLDSETRGCHDHYAPS